MARRASLTTYRRSPHLVTYWQDRWLIAHNYATHAVALLPPGAIALLDAWLKWARRCRLHAFVKLARTISEQRAGILAAIQHGLSNARVEAINTQIRLITRRAFGFHSPQALIALAMLSLADLCPPLPGR